MNEHRSKASSQTNSTKATGSGRQFIIRVIAKKDEFNPISYSYLNKSWNVGQRSKVPVKICERWLCVNE